MNEKIMNYINQINDRNILELIKINYLEKIIELQRNHNYEEMKNKTKKMIENLEEYLSINSQNQVKENSFVKIKKLGVHPLVGNKYINR